MAVLARLDRVRAHVHAASLDALVVTHLPNVRYLTGFTGTAGALVLLPDRCLLMVDFRYATAAQDLIASLPTGAIVIETVPQTYDAAIVDVLRRESSRRIGIEAAWLSVSRFNAMSSGLAAGTPTPLRASGPTPVLVATERLIERARMIKDAEEVEAIREGGRRISEIARRLADFVAPGRREDEIAAELDSAIRAAGFSRPAFETIVASGPNSALPHARPTGRRLEAGDSTVLDFGGIYEGYCVDLTRTVQLGAPSAALRQLYQAVAKAHEAAVAAVRPGVRPSAIDAAARDVLVQHGLGEAFGHGTGHGIGLEIHEDPRIGREMPGLPDAPVEPGMIFTIEPGAYLPGTGGVRIEDDVLVTADGCELLTDAPQLMMIDL
ncbi:MAG: Xaa-Pro dipeptidase [Acidobacteria bacterium]|nr:MAG: Xaa-Pro dipeptidase [Acidobacteriota bacterium]